MGKRTKQDSRQAAQGDRTRPEESAEGALQEVPQQFPLWTTAPVAERLRDLTKDRQARFVDVILAQVEEHLGSLDDIIEAHGQARTVVSPLFGRRRALDVGAPPMVQVTVQGLMPSQRQVLEDLGRQHGVSASRLITAVLDYGLPDTD